MQSNYDTDDATDVESGGPEFYSEESAAESDDGEEQYGFDDSESDGDREEIDYDGLQQNFTVLNEHDIRQRQEDDINTVSNVLSTSRAHACLLLQHYNWNVSKVHEEWFADEESVCKTVGLLGKPIEILDGRELICGICFDIYPWREITTAACGHLFCNSCWGGYIGTAINDGPGCLSLRCPDPSCSAAIGQDMFDVHASCEDKKKYYHYLLRSYIENNSKIKWCPAPGCELAVDFVLGCGIYDVSCNCSYSFCWNCTEEAHRPVECCTVAKWILKNNAESENVKWILANSKPCPKCKRPIEKRGGCMHMTCGPPCNFSFCWLCLGTSHHGGSCNRYIDTKEGVTDESGKLRERAKNSLERYKHYYERWASNQQSGQKAQTDLHSMKTQKMFEKLSKSQDLPETQLNFITEAMLQVIECRRVLKWTYAYGYYLPHEHAKKQFFEYLQGEAEAGLERLHRCVEKELQVYLDNEIPMNKFKEFRLKLLQLTSVTGKYFENLVQALESGLKDIDDDSGSSSSSTVELPDWSCKRCTYDNPFYARKCRMCKHPKSK